MARSIRIEMARGFHQAVGHFNRQDVLYMDDDDRRFLALRSLNKSVKI